MNDPEAALDVAVLTLAEVCKHGNDDDRVKAATVLLQAVKEEREWNRRVALSSVYLPLLRSLGGNLAGGLEAGHPYGPVFELTPLEQGNLLLALTKVVE